LLVGYCRSERTLYFGVSWPEAAQAGSSLIFENVDAGTGCRAPPLLGNTLTGLVHMRREKLAIASIYVPVKRRATLRPEIVQEIAQSMLEVGQTTPILVRRDGERFVLVHGLHRLEACKALGEESIFGYLVQAQKR
jgi:hypothetical protein